MMASMENTQPYFTPALSCLLLSPPAFSPAGERREQAESRRPARARLG